MMTAKPTISVVIVTYKRPKELVVCLGSVYGQTLPPEEVLVIDNAGDEKTRQVIEKQKKIAEAKGMVLHYVDNAKEDSLPTARNIGAAKAKGDYISYVDDDVVLDTDYHKNIFDVFRKHPQALVVQGYCETTKESHNQNRKKGLGEKIADMYGRLFQTSCILEEGKMRVLPSLCATYPLPNLQEVINCEWVVNAAAVYKKEVLKEFTFDEKLKRFAWGIDQDHPYRIFKKYPKSLFLTPHAKWWDKSSPRGRLPQKELIYMIEVYDLYVFYKIIDQTAKNTFLFLWRKGGNLLFRRVLFNLVTLGRGNPKIGFLKIRYALGAAWYAFKHRKEIKKGHLEFFNKTLE